MSPCVKSHFPAVRTGAVVDTVSAFDLFAKESLHDLRNSFVVYKFQ